VIVDEEKTQDKKRKRYSEASLDEKNKQQRKAREEASSNETSSSGDPSLSSSSSSDDEVEENEETQGVGSMLKQAASGGATSPQLAQETVSALKGATRIPVEMKEKWPQALDSIEKILKEKSCCDAILPNDTAVRIAIRALHCIASVASTLEWTPTCTLAAEVQSLITAMSSACSRNKTLCIHRYDPV
jgi:hypothetical protein